MQTLAIVTDDPGWHGRMLKVAFAKRGIDSKYLSLQSCEVDISAPLGVRLPGFSSPPMAVFVRGIPGGSLEQVITRLNVLHTLRESGIPVYNDARVIEKTVDKGMTSLVLARAGIPTPPTWVTENAKRLEDIVRGEWDQGHSVVMKPLFGSQGEGLERLTPDRPIPSLDAFHGVAYLQRFVHDLEGIHRDYRVFVIGGRAKAAMARHGVDWRNNVAQGGRCVAVELSDDLGALAEATSQRLGMDYAGVDILRTADAGLQVIEVNSVPAWYGLQSVSTEDIAALLAEDLMERVVRKTA